jgi:hypothetical protein
MTSLRSQGGIGVAAVNHDVSLLNEFRMAASALAMPDQSVASRVFATESISESDMHTIETSASNFQGVVSSVLSKMGVNKTSVVLAAEAAAVQGAFALGARTGHMARSTAIAGVSAPSGVEMFSVTAENVPAYHGKRAQKVVAAMEAFDQRDQRQSALYTMAYNYSVPLQSEFGETLYPLLNLPADQIGLGIIVNRLTVHKGLTHSVTGRAQELQKVDLTRAPVDASVLSRTKNAAVPVYRTAAADKFVDPTIVAPVQYTLEGADFQTAPLKIGVDANILGLSQTDAQLSAGSANQSDTLDPAVSLNNLYIKLGDDVIAYNVYGRHGANFVYNQQGRPEDRRLNFRSKFIVLNKDTKQVGNTALVDLADLATDNLSVVLDIAVDGTVNTEFGNVSVHGPRINLVRVLDADFKELPASNAKVQAIQALVAGGTVVGYDLKAYKTNVNLRERGDFIDRSQFVQLYEVPLLSPITAQRPVATNGEHDAADYETLVTTTRFRLAGDVVTAVFDAVDRLRAFTSVPFNNEDAPQGLGAARFHVKPFLAELVGADALDAAVMAQTLDSQDAAKNVAAAVVNKLRDIAFSMYIHSEYESAKMATGFIGETTVAIATDPYIRRYLQLDGEIRTLSEKFNVKIVDTLDKRFRGKIFMTFVVLNENRNEVPNILNWGNLVWSAETVISANIPRGESMTRETIVQPRYRFVEHLPVAALVEVKNIDKVFDENFLRVKQI